MKKILLMLCAFVTLGSSPAWANAAQCFQQAQTRYHSCRQACSTQPRCAARCYLHRRSQLRRCPGNPSQLEQSVLDLVNQNRTQQGLSALIWDIRLGEAAQGHAANMAATGQAVHDLNGKTPADRLRDAGYSFSREGENIYWGQGAGRDTPAAAVNWWLNSPVHRANMLSADFVNTGIGVRKAADGKWYFSQSFAKP